MRRHARLWVLPALMFLSACSQEAADYWQGYVEGDYEWNRIEPGLEDVFIHLMERRRDPRV
ncbi:MAG: hypothetical protein ACREVJ_11015 [Gammaproteobacteria bacterium]